MPKRDLCQPGIGIDTELRPGLAKSGLMTAPRRPKKLPPALRAIGTRVAELREQTGMTQTALAKKLGVKPNQISRLEAGERLLRAETMLLLCREFGDPVGYILGGQGEPPAAEFRETDRRRRPEPEST